jgi:hypothetical protein
MDVSCYDGSGKFLLTRGFSRRTGEPGTGSLLWGSHLKEFLDLALPRLDAVPAFRWGLYLFNEVTALSTHVAQMQIPSLWTVLEFSAYSFSESKKRDELLSEHEVEALHKPMKEILSTMGYGDDGTEEEIQKNKSKRSEVYTQLAQLKHRPIKTLVSELLAEYSLTEYLGEADSFYGLRNDVVHGRNIQLNGINYAIAISKFVRMLQKLLFSMAGCYDRKDFFKAPITDKALTAR